MDILQTIPMTFEVVPAVFLVTQVLKGAGLLPHKITQAFVLILSLLGTFYLERAITVETFLLGCMYATTAMKIYEGGENHIKSVTNIAVTKPVDMTKTFIGKMVK